MLVGPTSHQQQRERQAFTVLLFTQYSIISARPFALVAVLHDPPSANSLRHSIAAT